jgi:hypothetical protein
VVVRLLLVTGMIMIMISQFVVLVFMIMRLLATRVFVAMGM